MPDPVVPSPQMYSPVIPSPPSSPSWRYLSAPQIHAPVIPSPPSSPHRRYRRASTPVAPPSATLPQFAPMSAQSTSWPASQLPWMAAPPLYPPVALPAMAPMAPPMLGSVPPWMTSSYPPLPPPSAFAPNVSLPGFPNASVFMPSLHNVPSMSTHRDMADRIELCPWLIPNPNPANMGVAHIKWDMSLPPTTARRMSGTGIITSLESKFKDVATSPPVHHLQIICPAGPEEPLGVGIIWPILELKPVTPRDIVLGDILWWIYDWLNKPLSDIELALFKSRMEVAKQHFPYYESLEYAARQRAKVSREIGAVSGTGPYRRIDAMGSTQRFFGGMLVTYDNANSRWWLVLYGQPEPKWQ
ncbi:hypothetical protein EIP91_007153 [Steccherinum ochraceum]|uniref:DUF6699 domain-containing protein n=1 Tax=Steccherinum ochraceum TaxID=92696 RepID=A0A4R0RLE1_9APHY|nr:hypothetical protein EIP91_007153 [Steccherinum ochraceum]